MPRLFRSKFRVFIVVCFILLMWLSVSVNSKRDIPAKNDDILPQIEAKDQVDVLIQKASENFFYHEFTNAIENYREAIALLEGKQDFRRVAKTYESMGDMYKYVEDIPEAEKSYQRAADYHVQAHNVAGEARALRRIGDIHMERERFAPALQWYQKAAGVIKDEEVSLVQGEVFELLGRAYWKTDQLDEAISNVERARIIFSELKFAVGYDHMTRLEEAIKRQKKNAGPSASNNVH